MGRVFRLLGGGGGGRDGGGEGAERERDSGRVLLGYILVLPALPRRVGVFAPRQRKIQSRHRALVILPTIDPGRELNQFESA